MQVGETVQITAAQYAGGVGEITTNLILQTSANGTMLVGLLFKVTLVLHLDL